jgi:hypothetical protein
MAKSGSDTKAEIAELRSRNTALLHALGEQLDPSQVTVETEGDIMTIHWRGSPVMEVFFEAMAMQFLASGGINFCEWTAGSRKIGEFTVTIQRKEAKTPGELLAEVKREKKLAERIVCHYLLQDYPRQKVGETLLVALDKAFGEPKEPYERSARHIAVVEYLTERERGEVADGTP